MLKLIFQSIECLCSQVSRKSTGTEECEICFMKLPSSVSSLLIIFMVHWPSRHDFGNNLDLHSSFPQMMTGLECNHRFCTYCWTEYLTTKIMEEGLGQTISCAAHGCDILVDDATVMQLVKDSKVRLKYQQIITNSFVQVCFMLRF